MLLLPLLFLLGAPARPPPPDLDPFSSSEESDEIDPEGEAPGGSWRGDEALVDFPPRGRRRKREFLEPVYPRFVEHARQVPIQHRHVSLAMAEPEECDCPETLAKGTMVAIVAVLAFLGFFSTSVLLVVAICLLRLVDRQRKSGKDSNAASLAKRPLPPLPPPRPERVYLASKPTPGYERLVSASPHTLDGAYLSASELHPGPRVLQAPTYQKMGTYEATISQPHYRAPRNKAVPESEYITVNPAPGFSSPAPEKTYSGAGQIPAGKNRPGAEEEIYGSPDGTKPERSGEASPIGETPVSGRENHIYEEVE